MGKMSEIDIAIQEMEAFGVPTRIATDIAYRNALAGIKLQSELAILTQVIFAMGMELPEQVNLSHDEYIEELKKIVRRFS